MENKIVKKEENTFQDGVNKMIADREYFKTHIEKIMIEGKDFHIIKGKKSLAKGGAEKLASAFRYHAKFRQDEDANKAFSDIKGLIAYRCELVNDQGVFIGEGGGADTLEKNQNDPNKTIKMAQKRAFIDAVIRATGMSDIFTQDLEDMKPTDIKTSYIKNDNYSSNGVVSKSKNKPGKCPRCGAEMKFSSRGNWYCSGRCWEKEAVVKEQSDSVPIIDEKTGLEIPFKN